MKRSMIRIMALGLVLALALCGCGSKKPFQPEETADGLLSSGAFSEELERMDRRMFVRYYGLDDTNLETGIVYGSTGSTAEEFAVLIFSDEESAKGAETALKAHIEDQLEANRDYRPGDMPKLEKAVLERRKNTLLLVVANDYAAVSKITG